VRTGNENRIENPIALWVGMARLNDAVGQANPGQIEIGSLAIALYLPCFLAMTDRFTPGESQYIE